MPWTPKDASRFTKHAKGREKQWAQVANSVLHQTGDDGAAVKAANAAVHRGKKK